MILDEIEDDLLLYPNSMDGEILDFFVAKARGFEAIINREFGSCMVKVTKNNKTHWTKFNPSTHWTHGGPLIDIEHITIEFQGMLGDDNYWVAYYGFEQSKENETACCGPTPLVAAMRCVVKEMFGDEIDPTKEL